MPNRAQQAHSLWKRCPRWCQTGLLVGISGLCLALPMRAQEEDAVQGPLTQPDFIIDLTSVAVADHPPGQITRTGENLHGLNQATGQVIECVQDPSQPFCPVFTFATRGGVFGVDLKLFYADELGLGVISTAYTSPPGCVDLGCAIPTPGDNKRALDTGYLMPYDQSEPFVMAHTGILEFTEITVDDNADAELQWVTAGCLRPFDFSVREALPVFDPPTNRRRDVYRPPFDGLSGGVGRSVGIAGNEPNLVAGGTDGVRLARFRTR